MEIFTSTETISAMAVKEFEIAHSFFVTNGLKTTFLKSPWKIDVEKYLSTTIFKLVRPLHLQFCQPFPAPKILKLAV